MMETQASISTWAEQTFGPVSSNLRIAVRAAEEMAELLRAISTGQSRDQIVEEAADVAIVLYRLAERQRLVIEPYGCKRQGVRSQQEVAAEANQELALIIMRLSSRDDDRYIAYSLRQIFFCLEQLCQKRDRDLYVSITVKMQVNRSRQWCKDASGHGYHVQEVSA